MASITRSRVGYLLTNFTKVLGKPTTNFYKTQQSLFHWSPVLCGKGQEINMPSLSPTMTEGKIVKWLKAEGDVINPGDAICEIETDKAIVAMEIEEEGVLAKILVPENSSHLKVGSLIALMVSEGEDWKNVDVPSGAATGSSQSSSSTSSSSSETAPKEPKETTVSGPPTFPIKMPSLSPTMTAGTIVKWLKKEGDTLAPGDVLCDIQTDKAVMSMEAEEEGILAKILMPDDSQNVTVGTLIALVVPEGEDWKSVVVTAAEPSAAPEESAKPQSAPSVGSGDVREKSYGPAVKAMLSEYQIEPGLIKATGRNNRLLKEDVIKYIEDNRLQKKPPKTVSPPSQSKPKTETPKPKSVPQKASTALGSKYIDIEISNSQQVAGRRMVQSKQQVPHSYSVTKCNIGRLLEALDGSSAEGVSLSRDDLLTKATALALQIYPKANALCINNEVRLSKDVDICVVVPTSQGLYTPIVKSANLKSITTISQEIKNYTEAVKNGQLNAEVFQEGGSFTISNLGMFGVTHFKAVINPPQCGVLAVGATIESFDTDLVLQKHVILSLSYDRRALEEHEAGEFLETLKYVIENPKLILVDANRNSIEMGL